MIQKAPSGTLLLCMRGYSASGKTTLARKICTTFDAVMLSRDELRQMMFGSAWTGVDTDEVKVTVAERAMAHALMQRGQSIVIDATNLSPRIALTWAQFTAERGAHFEIVDVHATLQECLRRNHNPNRRMVPDEVIQRQHAAWPVREWPSQQDLISGKIPPKRTDKRGG